MSQPEGREITDEEHIRRLLEENQRLRKRVAGLESKNKALRNARSRTAQQIQNLIDKLEA